MSEIVETSPRSQVEPNEYVTNNASKYIRFRGLSSINSLSQNRYPATENGVKSVAYTARNGRSVNRIS